jgi:hypothetical protein
VDSRPVDLLRDIARSEVDQSAALHAFVAISDKRQPDHRSLAGVNDEQLLDMVGGVERELLPRVFTRLDNFHEQCGSPIEHLIAPTSM